VRIIVRAHLEPGHAELVADIGHVVDDDQRPVAGTCIERDHEVLDVELAPALADRDRDVEEARRRRNSCCHPSQARHHHHLHTFAVS